MTDPTPFCTACQHITYVPREGAKRPDPVCARNNNSAYLERADPNGCGPAGQFYVGANG